MFSGNYFELIHWIRQISEAVKPYVLRCKASCKASQVRNIAESWALLEAYQYQYSDILIA